MSDTRQELGGPESVIRAVDHLDADESVVRSGLALADAVIKSLESQDSVIVSFDGLKGASSSYFNVFLRRIQEGCGVVELGEHIQLEFGSKIQRMIYDRSLEALEKGPRRPSQPSATEEPADPPARLPFWKRILGI